MAKRHCVVVHVEHEGSTATHQNVIRQGHDGLQSCVIVPPTVLVTELDNGTLILQGRPGSHRESTVIIPVPMHAVKSAGKCEQDS